MRRSARDYPCNSVFPAASSGGAAKNQQIIFKPSGPCPGRLSLCPANVAGLFSSMPCKAFSGFLSGFYSCNIH
nr:MAG TPA: hypothetical protein [Caudoviricetes sp.]